LNKEIEIMQLTGTLEHTLLACAGTYQLDEFTKLRGDVCAMFGEYKRVLDELKTANEQTVAECEQAKVRFVTDYS
jgi:hypothetical protein